MEGRDFVQSVTCPLIAVTADEMTQQSIRKNNIPNLVQFLRPFGLRIPRAITQDIHGNPIQLDGYNLRFVDLHKIDTLDPVLVHSVLQTDILPKYSTDYTLPTPKTVPEANQLREKRYLY